MQGGRRIGRYVLGPAIATGGMASVHLARMLGKGGFGKTVAMKRLHAQYAREAEFVTLFQDEARVTSGLTHANIVMTLDILEDEEELYLVMEYVHGASLSQILKSTGDGQSRLPLRIAVGIIAAMLDGLHAAHEATDENGNPLHIIHRDVSPQNVLVTFQGVTKIADFGIAKAAGRVHSTDDGSVKGKIGYLAPEQLLATEITPQTDVYAAGVVLWETLTNRRLIDFNSTGENLRAVLELDIEPPSKISADLPPALDEVVMRAVESAPEDRFASAKEMGIALRRATDVAHAAEIGDWLRAERPHLLQMRELGIADLQRAIGRLSGAGEVAPRASVPEIEVATVINKEEEGSASPEPSSDPSYWTGAKIPPPQPRWIVPTLTTLLALGTAAVLFFMLTRGPSPHPSRSSEPPVSIASGSVPLETSSASTAPPHPSAIQPAASSTSIATATSTPTAGTPPAASSQPAPSSTTPASASAKPLGLAPRRCRIVPMTDSVGHTKFTEVCQ